MTFLNSVLLIRYLGPSNYGLYAIASAIATMFQMFIDFGSYAMLFRNVYKDVNDILSSVSELISFSVVMALPFLFLIVTVGFFMQLSVTDELIVVFVGLYSAVKVLQEIRMGLTVLLKRTGIELLFSIADRLGILIITVTASILKFTVLDIVIGYSMLSLVNLIISFMILGRNYDVGIKLVFIKLTRFLELLKNGMTIAILNGSVQFYTKADVFILARFTSNIYAGEYSAVRNIILASGVIPLSLSNSRMTEIVHNYENKKLHLVKKTINKMFVILILFSVPVAAFISILAKHIIPILYSRDYSGASVYLEILAWLIPVMYLTDTLGRILVSIKKDRGTIIVSISSMIINVALNLFLVPLIGHQIVAWIAVFSEVIVLIMMLRIAASEGLVGF